MKRIKKQVSYGTKVLCLASFIAAPSAMAIPQHKYSPTTQAKIDARLKARSQKLSQLGNKTAELGDESMSFYAAAQALREKEENKAKARGEKEANQSRGFLWFRKKPTAPKDPSEAQAAASAPQESRNTAFSSRQSEQHKGNTYDARIASAQADLKSVENLLANHVHNMIDQVLADEDELARNLEDLQAQAKAFKSKNNKTGQWSGSHGENIQNSRWGFVSSTWSKVKHAMSSVFHSVKKMSSGKSSSEGQSQSAR